MRFCRANFSLAASLVAALALASCAPREAPLEIEKLTLQKTTFAALEGWGEDRHAEALAAFLLSCPALAKDGAAAAELKTPQNGSAGGFGALGAWRAACDEAKTIGADDASARAFFERRFTPYLAGNNGQPEGLFTGYYVPELKGARTKTARFRVPIYRLPDDLVTADLGLFKEELKGQRIAGKVEKGKLKPYDSRAEIERGALAGKGLEILYVDDPVDAFFLHIQGSGRVVLEEGGAITIGYAGANGRPYVAIGRALVQNGAMDKDSVTMQSIRAWLAAHPGEAEKTMEANPSYVFFRELPGTSVVGAAGVDLTPGRSLAVDRRFVPYGVPLWLQSQGGGPDAAALRRLMVAQDTGGAITGPVRGDVFWGFGHEAGERAGRMKDAGRYFLLLPKPAEVAGTR
jgi:membrane-bound lytic murein transglycosylase A